MFWTLLLTLGSAYCGFALLLFFFQSHLVHLPGVPGRELIATPAQVDLEYQTVSFTTSDDVKLHGWYIPAQRARGTLLFFHGNAGNISHRLDSLTLFNRLELNILIFDYRGYGRSEGSPSEEGLYKDASAALRYLQQERDIPAKDIVYFGRSLGGAVAAWLAARHPPNGLILESSFTSARAMACELYPFLPTRLLTRLRYDTLENLQAVKNPVLIIHSRDDEIIPFAHGQKLFSAAAMPKQFLEIRGDHNSGFIQSGQHYVNGIAKFLHLIEESSIPKKGSPEKGSPELTKVDYAGEHAEWSSSVTTKTEGCFDGHSGTRIARYGGVSALPTNIQPITRSVR